MIFYFSATGNSLEAAKYLEKELSDKSVNMVDAMKESTYDYDIKDGEIVGFVFPVYFYGIPTIVNDFISKVSFPKNVYIYGVITCGGNIAGADKQFTKRMGKRGFTVSTVFELLMPSNYVLMYELSSDREQVQELAAAHKRLKIIANELKKIKENNEEIELFHSYHSSKINHVTTAVAYSLYNLVRRTKKFYADENCIGCKLCERICPCNAIKMEDGRPKWVEKKCSQCLGCINRCPKKSIQYGKATIKRRRYVNPILK